MLEQALLDYAKRPACTILRQRAVSKDTIDVETAFELVRITRAADGSITLAGWRKGGSNYDPARRTHELLTGTWMSGRGWAVTITTVQKATFAGLRAALPRGA